MYIEVTCFEAARILVSGGHVWDGCDAYAGCVELIAPRRGHACHTRELRKWTRWCASHENKWYIYKRG